MGEAKRSVDCTPRDFLAAWGRGDAGLVPCGACTACCHYPGIVVDEKRDRRRLAHLLTERSPEGELVLQRRSDGACVHLGERGCTVSASATAGPGNRAGQRPQCGLRPGRCPSLLTLLRTIPPSSGAERQRHRRRTATPPHRAPNADAAKSSRAWCRPGEKCCRYSSIAA
jgi:hypothetical protein